MNALEEVSRASSSVQSKLSLIISRHEQLKVSFEQLNHQIRTGFIEVEDQFASMSTLLMKLVGLKTAEMAAEGRSSTVLISTDEPVPVDDDFLNSAMIAGNELVQNQKRQLMQLINILKSIQAQVNESQNSIFVSLSKHQHFTEKIFFQAFTHVDAIHQSNGHNEISLSMLRLLKSLFGHVRGAFGSVEVGMEDLFSDLSEILCKPMAQYVKDLKVEMTHGACPHLLEVIKEMDGAMRLKKFELEEARNNARLAEQSRAETLTKLLKLEETAKRLTSLGLLMGSDTTDQEESSKQQQILTVKGDPAKDDSLLGEFRRKKRKCNMSKSPFGPSELLDVHNYDRRFNMTRALPAPSHWSVTRSQTKQLDPHSLMTSNLLLGSSPSASTQIGRRKHRTP